MSTTPGGMLRELREAECWERLESRPVGRLAWKGSEGLTVVPVNYRVRDGKLLVHTAAYSLAARECDDSPVAFEIDEIDEVGRRGWSVLARGVAHFEHGAFDAEGPEVWAPGIRALRIVIDVRSVTGRQLSGD